MASISYCSSVWPYLVTNFGFFELRTFPWWQSIDSSNRWSIGTNGRISTNRKGCHSSGSLGEYASHKGDLDYFPMWPGWVQGNSDGPLVPMVRLVPIENDVIPMVLLVNMHLIIIRGLRLFSPVAWLGTGQFRWSIGANFTIGTNSKGCHSNGSIAE